MTDFRSRRSALHVAGSSALALMLAGARPTTAQQRTLRVAGLFLDVTAQGYYALDQEFFKAEGLAVDVIPVQNGAAAAAALVSGNLDFGAINVVALASAHEKGIPFVWAAPAGAYSNASPTAEMVVAKSSPIASAKDCVGKVVAVVLLKQLADIALHAWLTKSGVDPASLHAVEMPYSAMDAALASGRIDLACIEEPALSLTLASNGRVLASGYSAIANQFCEAAWVCTSDFAKANPDLVRRFAATMATTAQWANKNQAATAKILEKYGKAALPAGMHRCYNPPRLIASDLQPVVDAAAAFGVIKQRFDVRSVFA